MKTKSLLLAVFTTIGFSCTCMAQSVSCADFTVLGINPDPFDPNVYNVSIQFSAPSTDHVNYPYVSAVLDCNGDTVATGGMSFFAQIGQTTNDYAVTLSGSLACEPLTAVFVYGVDAFDMDTCSLSFGTTAGLSDTYGTANAFSLFPNPVKSQVTIQTGIDESGTNYFAYDHTGKLMLTGRIDSENTAVDMSHLSRGIYLFRFGSDLKQTFKVVKE
ncbi:T9SS type A sorting domain-containing protein [uncultured Fluviicola sp.]|uniref:T9SS type A sorting domain-containing protein n=1 Tax=uncultured Fluviicola sp. TaxID=463303 RepID=UPI0025F2C244|nr:T9SS type A sorting domain-containing protein [uncultured Fluviicola sp.]